MTISPRDLARSIEVVAELDPAADPQRALEVATEAARTLLDTDTAGLLLANGDGELEWTVGADARAEFAVEAQRRLTAGPCVVAYEESRPVVISDVTTDHRWKPLEREFAAAGVRACLSVPVRMSHAPVGALDLYSRTPRDWDDSQIAAAWSFAGVIRMLLASIRAAASASQLAEQLQRALTSRVQIEQAKGALMASSNLSEQDAWERLRGTARSTRRPVTEVAAEVLAQLTQEPTASASGAEPAQR